MFLTSATPTVASYAAKQKAKAAAPARHFAPSSTGSSSGIFEPLVVSRMNRAGLEIEQLLRNRASKS